MVKEDTHYASPIATVFYEFYDDIAGLAAQLKTQREFIQCIVSNGFISDEIAFGSTQKPQLEDYADGIDTIDFLLKI